MHLAAGLVTAAGTKFAYDSLDKYRIDRELVTWDYIKKHPQDFPEVFNRMLNFLSIFNNLSLLSYPLFYSTTKSF